MLDGFRFLKSLVTGSSVPGSAGSRSTPPFFFSAPGHDASGRSPSSLVSSLPSLGALLFLAVLTFGAAVEAQAQTTPLVSNLGQGTDTVTMDSSWGAEVQGFRTGTHSTGYSLTSVDLYISSFVSPATIADMEISLWMSATDNVWGLLSTATVVFSNPTFTSAGNVTFTLPANTTIDLAANTVYFVSIDSNNTDGDSGVNIGTTTETTEDSGAAAGWIIDDNSFWPDDLSAWIPNGYMYRIAVNGIPKNIRATGRPTITGTAAAVGDVLTAVTTGIADVDGLNNVSYSYQWIRVDDMAVETDISSATSSTYTLVAADVGKHFKVKVTFQDDRGFDEERKSKLYPDRTGGICARTEQVRDAIVAGTAATTCTNVTMAHLSGLWPRLNLSNKGLSSLQSGDLDGLTALTRLDLNGNALTTLPAGIFDELTALQLLNLQDNALTTLPSGIFDELTALRTGLNLHNNALTILPSGIFDPLTALQSLNLQDNELSSLPSGIFDELTELTRLTLSYNKLTSLPAGLFTGLTNLEDLSLANNDTLTSLPAGLFTGLIELDDLNLSNNALSSLPPGIFDGLTELDTLRLAGNALTDLPADIFQDLTTLTTLRLQNNSNTDPFAPATEAGQDQMVATGATVMLAGSSTGPWGTNVTFAWTQTSGSTVTLTGADTASPSFTAPLTAGALEFELTVTGQGHNSGTGTDTVTVTVTDPRTLATLSNLTLSSGVLDPEFDIDTTAYTASVLNAVSTLTVTPTTTGSNAMVAFLNDANSPITDTDTNTEPLDMTLAVGDNVIKVKVTAEIGGAEKTYTITVTREAPNVTVPGAPTGLTATPDDEPTQINLEWTAPVDNGNSLITGYRIEVSNNGNNGSWIDLEANTGNTDTTYEHNTGLAPGDTRHYRVSARNALGLSAPSGTDSATTLSGGICTRTAQVRNAIVDEIMDVNSSVTTCADVTSAHLMSLSSTLDLTSKGINSLKTGDFVGLTNLTGLILERNALTELPAGIFDPLTALQWLDLGNNALSSLPADIFDGLTALRYLNLFNTALTARELPAGIFNPLTALEVLRLGGVNVDLNGLPAGIFDPLTALTELYLDGTSLTSLPRGIFDRLTRLQFLSLCGTDSDIMMLELLELPAFLYNRYIADPSDFLLCQPENVTRLGSLSRGNSAATGAPTIMGTAQVGKTLTAGIGDIADANGLPSTDFPTGYSFQWIRVDSDGSSNPTNISSATSATYTPGAADVGKKVSVKVSFTDGASNSEELTSDAYPSSGTIVGEECAVSDVTDDESLERFVECAAERIEASESFEDTLSFLEEFRDDEGNWNDGSTYLVLFTKRGGVYFHANDREVEDLDWSGILSCEGGESVLDTQDGCFMEYDGASSGYAYPFSASHVPLAHGEEEFVLLGGFDETPEGTAFTGTIGVPSTEAGEVDTDDELREFVGEAGRVLGEAVENPEIDPAQLRGILRREGPWKEGNVYVYIMDETGRVIFDGAYRSREQKNEYAKQYVRDIIAEAGERIVEYREGGLLRRGYAVRVEAPLDEDEASRVYIVGSGYRVEEEPGGGGCAVGGSDRGGHVLSTVFTLFLILSVFSLMFESRKRPSQTAKI